MKSLLWIILLFSSINSFAQTSTSDGTISTLEPGDKIPEFPGGTDEMNRFIMKNLSYPEKERKENIQGTVYVSVVVEKDGSLSSIEVVRGVEGGPGLSKEALRIIQM